MKKLFFLLPFLLAMPQQSYAQIITDCPKCTQEETETVRWAQQLASMLDELQRVKSELYADLGEVESLRNIGSGQALTGALNIHRILEHVRLLACNGFAKGIKIVERYDPSLPHVWGDRDRLVQVLLNLVKNAAEAIRNTDKEGEITLLTSYRPRYSGGCARHGAMAASSVGGYCAGYGPRYFRNSAPAFVRTVCLYQDKRERAGAGLGW